MKNRYVKATLILSLLLFATTGACARSVGGGRITGRPSESPSRDARNQREAKGSAFETQEEPKYLGNVQFDLGYAIGTAKYYSYSSDTDDYTRHNSDTIRMFTRGLENHNLFRITSLKKINIYAGFMSSFFFSLGDTFLWESAVGGEVAVKFSKIALVQAAMGLDVGLSLTPASFLAPAFFFEFQAKFLPDSFFSPLIGMKFTKFSVDDDEDPASVSSNAFYLGGSFNFRSRGKR